MYITQYFGTNENEIASKKRNILIPVCLGNKFFSYKGVLTKNVESYLNWALENTKDKVLITIPDKIQDTNFFIRNKHDSITRSRKQVLKEGKIIFNSIETLISNYPSNKKEKIDIIRWDDFEKNDPYNLQTTLTIYKEFKNNIAFQKKVIEVVKGTLTDRTFEEKQYWKLTEYILDEFSFCYSGVHFKDTYYDLGMYPQTDKTLEFIEGIKARKIFPKLHDILPNKKSAWAIIK